MKLFYILKNNEKKYVDNIFVIVKLLYGDLIKIDRQDSSRKIYYNLLSKDARDVSNKLFLANSKSPISFNINLENIINWNSNFDNLYYLSSNEKAFSNKKELLNWIKN